jgi:hypothetical protein
MRKTYQIQFFWSNASAWPLGRPRFIIRCAVSFPILGGRCRLYSPMTFCLADIPLQEGAATSPQLPCPLWQPVPQLEYNKSDILKFSLCQPTNHLSCHRT